jgi:hypothetical protein
MSETNESAPLEELPELTLSLRNLGSYRHSDPTSSREGPDDQERFFTPLLDARRRAVDAVTAVQLVAAFDARRIMALLDATVRAFANERYAEQPPARRAFEAELFELVEPLRASLQRLRDCAESHAAARAEQERRDCWAAWLEQLRDTFRVADANWIPLGVVLAAAVPAPRRRRLSWRSRKKDQGESGGER